MTISGFLNIADIPGESVQAAHSDEIEVFSVAWEIAQPDPGTGAARGRSRAEYSSFEFGKFFDRSSPYLALATSHGKVFNEIVFTATTNSAGATTDYLTITLGKPVLTSYQLDTGDDQLVELISIKARLITIDYTEIDAQGAVAGNHSVDIQAG